MGEGNIIKIFLKVFIFFIIFNSCYYNKNENLAILLKLTIFRFSNEIYIFELKTDGILNVFSGDRYSGNFNDPNNINVIKKEAKKLSESNFIQIKQIISKIEEYSPPEIVVMDSWKAEIELDNKKYRFNYGVSNDKNLDTLVTKIIEFSPFEIVDASGKPVVSTNYVHRF